MQGGIYLVAILVDPPSYITSNQFRSMANDYDLSSYTDSQLQDMLNRASGQADALMRRSLLAQERTRRYIGNGTNRLDLKFNPLLYVKRLQIVIPGISGPIIPIDQLLVDYESGEILEYTPLTFEGQGYFSRFPNDIPVDVTLAYGYGYGVVKAPTWTYVDQGVQPGQGLAPGSYDIAVTSKTMYGETTATLKTVSTTTGSILITVAPTVGAYLYRAYAAPHGTTPLTLIDESPFTAYGTTAMFITVASLLSQNNLWPDPLPTEDSSAPALPYGITEAVRLLTLSAVYEGSNLANRGVEETRSGRKGTRWLLSAGTSAKGESATMTSAKEMLRPYSLQAIY